MTDKEFRIIGHSLGVKIDKYTGDKNLPKEYYRNYYQAGKDSDNWSDLLKLVKTRLMSQREQFDMPVFHVTDEGKERFRLKFVSEIELKK